MKLTKWSNRWVWKKEKNVKNVKEQEKREQKRKEFRKVGESGFDILEF